MFTSIAVLVFVIIFGSYMLLSRKTPEEKAVIDRTKKMISNVATDTTPGKLFVDEDNQLSNVSHGHRAIRQIETLIQQGAIKMTLPTFFAASVGTGFLGAIIGFMLAPLFIFEFMFFFVFSLGPYLYLVSKRNKRIAAFDKQIPDTIDLLSRSVKAGHAVPVALEFVATQAEEPVKSEFAVLSGQINVGLSQQDALEQMSARVPSQDLRFVITAILIQRETGGNLPEVLDQTIEMIRERNRILGDAKVKTAQARLSGLVLTFLPIGIALLMRFLSPELFGLLVTDPWGRFMLYYSAASLVIGALLIRMITKLEV